MTVVLKSLMSMSDFLGRATPAILAVVVSEFEDLLADKMFDHHDGMKREVEATVDYARDLLVDNLGRVEAIEAIAKAGGVKPLYGRLHFVGHLPCGPDTPVTAHPSRLATREEAEAADASKVRTEDGRAVVFDNAYRMWAYEPN